MNNTIIIIPTVNEKKNIEILFNKLTETNMEFDLLFIDDNSNDGSQEVIKNLVKKNQNINYIFRPKKWVLVQLTEKVLSGLIKKIIK